MHRIGSITHSSFPGNFAFLSVLAAWLSLGPASAYALRPPEILLLVNKDTPVSSDVARMYQRLRSIPAENTLRLSLGGDRSITRKQYRDQIVPPVKKYLQEHPAIQCIVTTSGFPYVIQNTAGTEDGAAVDNELAAVLLDEPKDLNRWQPNPFYLRGQNLFGSGDPRTLRMVFVMRLDGPDLKTITRMVEDAIATEATGLAGPVFGDAMGLDGNTGKAAADLSIRRAIDELSGAGFAATLDLNEADWRQPAGGVGEQAAGAAFYVGWYNLQNFQNIFGKQGLARGAIAWHIASDEAVDLWNLNSREWCINLMRHGAAVTLGPAFEPYVGAFPKAEIFVEALLEGKSVAESYWLSLPHVSWAMVILGDPLYRPFAKARPTLVPRAYVAANATHVLEKGQTSPLMIQIQCVGPAGSSTPSLAAVAEAGMGLAGASGAVSIPALQAGQTAVVRVPTVIASNNSTGMFRLHLNVQNEDEKTRRVVLEGRTGFSAISGGVHRQTLMAVSPGGELAITGRPEDAYLTETATLQSKRITTAQGWLVAAAAFAPDGSHSVLTLLNPEKRQASYVVMDNKSLQTQGTPSGLQFLRWLDKSTLLMKTTSGLTEYDISAGTRLPVFEPAGWTVNNIIPGTAIQFLVAQDGRFAVRNGGGEIREILAGTGAKRDRAIADDLSQFGGLDEQKQLWVQQGLQNRPEVVSRDVNRILWGPVSRRVLVEGPNGAFRIYDGRDRSWISLPPITMARWSPDENRMLYIEAERQDGGLVAKSLSLLTGRQTQQICDLNCVGDVGAMALSQDGETAFLLAGADAGLRVWLMPLPRTASHP
jgi:uncharacterized protein (TIGR03790 family)